MSVTTSGLQSKSGNRITRSVIEVLSSMRFAISLLVILSIASIIGTVLTQDDPYPNYVNQFGPFWADIFRSLSLYTVYSSWWFMLILGFLMVSVSLCVLRNAPKMLADAKSWKDKVREGSLRAFHHKGEFAVQGTRVQTSAVLARLSARLGYKPKNPIDPGNLSAEQLEEVESFLAALDANEDVQHVFAGLQG